jgi:hypothetical protein
LNRNNSTTVEGIGLNLLHRGPLEWYYIHAKFYENLPSGSKLLVGATDRQTGDVISLLSFLQSTLQIIPYKTPRLPLREHLTIAFCALAVGTRRECAVTALPRL